MFKASYVVPTFTMAVNNEGNLTLESCVGVVVPVPPGILEIFQQSANARYGTLDVTYNALVLFWYETLRKPSICIVGINESGDLETTVPYVGGFMPFSRRVMDRFKLKFPKEDPKVKEYLTVVGSPLVPPDELESKVGSLVEKLKRLGLKGRDSLKAAALSIFPLDDVYGVRYNQMPPQQTR